MTKKTESKKNITWEHSPFMELFSSAVFFLQKSIEEPQNFNLFSRESIVNCVFALEAAANCALDRLDLPNKFKDDADKLTTINKFELFLIHNFLDTNLDRGSEVVQKIEELINIRNKFVHPRYVKIKGEYLSGTVYKAEKVDKKNVTRIPNLTSQWTPVDATNAVEATVKFFIHFFIEICQFTEEEVSGILCTKNHYPDGSANWIISQDLALAFKILKDMKVLKKNFMKVPEGNYDINFIIEEDAGK